MSETSEMSNPTTSSGLTSATSSPASADGPRRLDSRIGQDPAGQGLVPASLSARQAEVQGLLTSGTSGQRGSISSASVALTSSLVNRLTKLTRGSTLFT